MENYKYEAGRKRPETAFVEDTLRRIKKSMEKPKKPHEIWKTIGGIGLSAAVLVGAFFGAGAVRSFFENIKPIETDNEIPDITEETITEEPVETKEDRINATESEISVTPLSNPKYTVKANTPDGRVSLDEHTTPEEMLACGVPVETEKGILGMQYVCEALRKYKNRQDFEFIYGDVTEDYGNRYDYFKYEARPDDLIYQEDKLTYWEYQHRGYLSISKYNGQYDYRTFADLSTFDKLGGYVAIKLNNNHQSYSDTCGIVTMYDTYDVTGFSKEVRKQLYYNDITNLRVAEGYTPILSVIYNGECLGKFRMNYFIENIENGEKYASVQYTDITTTAEYDERYYSIEYCDGIYSIFTMTNGLDGVFDTQYFNGYTVLDNQVVFDNGNVKYTFDLSEDPDADASQYGENLHVRDNLRFCYDMNPYYIYSTHEGEKRTIFEPLNMFYDNVYVNKIVSEKDFTSVIQINEGYSTDTHKAVRLDRIISDGLYCEAVLFVNEGEKLLGTANNGDTYKIGTISFYTVEGNLEFYSNDGRDYIMLTEEDIESLNYDNLYLIEKGESANGREWLINQHIYR